MLRFRLEAGGAPAWQRGLIPILAVLVTFVLTAVLVLLARANPLEAFYYFLVEPFTARSTAIEILVKSTPLLLAGVAVAFAFVAGYFNIGGEGQLYARAIPAARLRPPLAGAPATGRVGRRRGGCRVRLGAVAHRAGPPHARRRAGSRRRAFHGHRRRSHDADRRARQRRHRRHRGRGRGRRYSLSFDREHLARLRLLGHRRRDARRLEPDRGGAGRCVV